MLVRDLYYYYLIKKSGLFDRAYYLLSYPDVRKTDVDPIFHYIRFGWKEGRNPSAKFDTNYYLEIYSDIKDKNINPFIHYIKFGIHEGRFTNKKNIADDTSKIHYQKFINNLPQVANGFIFISHEASLTGAPINLLNMCKAYQEFHGDDFIIITLRGGPLLEEYCELGKTLNLANNEQGMIEDVSVVKVLSKIYSLGYRNCIGNTVLSGQLITILENIGFNTTLLIHELPYLINEINCNTIANVISSANADVVFPASFVAIKFMDTFGLSKERTHIVPQGIREEMVYKGNRTEAIRNLLDKLGIDFKKNIRLVLGVGYAHDVKGTDLFIKVAEYLFENGQLEDIHFLWLGNRNEKYERIKKEKELLFPFSDNLHFLEFEEDPAYIFAAADAYLLTSRSDSYPSAALEALANNTPVIMFQDTSGIEEIIDGKNGITVPKYSIRDMATTILEWLDKKERENIQINAEINSYEEYVNELVEINRKKEINSINLHKVSVIIPNFNYQKYLNERIKSIINQSYTPDEIIFLDDDSTDNSVRVADNILSRSNIPFKIIENKKNQGVFKQWVNGINAATNEYIWIAEADDIASPDFLSTIMKGFKHPDVVVSYCQSQQIDEYSNRIDAYNYQNYIGDLSKTKWQKHYVENGLFEVQNYLAIKNTIPNASAVVIKKSSIENIKDNIINFHYAGDWFAYLSALNNGNISYSPKILNFFRRHNRSVFASAGRNERFYQEICEIYTYVVENFRINPQTINMMKENFEAEGGGAGKNFSSDSFFQELENTSKQKIKKLKKLNILIILSEFMIGGGEITGLRLANHLAKQHNVYLYSAKKNKSKNFMKMVNPDVNILQDSRSVNKLIHSGKINFVNSHIWWGDKFTYKQLKDNQVFWILSMHGCYEMLMNNPAVDPEFLELAEEMLERANFISFDAEKNLAYPKSLKMQDILDKTIKINHGFSPELVKEKISKSDLGFSEDTFLFVFVGRGIKEKGWEEAIASTNQLKLQGYNIGLIMIGDSPYVEQLKKENSDQDFIRFFGEQHDLQKFFGIADCGILPTYFVSESQPLTIIEYLAAGLPIIATDIGEIKSMITMNNEIAGITISLKNGKIKTKDLANKMKKIISDKEFYSHLKDATSKIFYRKFTIEKFTEAYLSLYYAMGNCIQEKTE